MGQLGDNELTETDIANAKLFLATVIAGQTSESNPKSTGKPRLLTLHRNTGKALHTCCRLGNFPEGFREMAQWTGRSNDGHCPAWDITYRYAQTGLAPDYVQFRATGLILSIDDKSVASAFEYLQEQGIEPDEAIRWGYAFYLKLQECAPSSLPS